MSVINANPLLAAAGGDYQISRSVRLRSSATAYLNRTPASAGNQKTWTWSGWVKSGVSDASLFSAYGGSALARCEIRLSGNQLQVFNYNTSSVYDWTYQTNAVYRDPSAWYHFVVVVDSTASTGNRVKMWVNGVQVTSWASSSEPSLNFNSYVNAATPTYIGKNAAAAAYCEAYLTEVNFIDGQALTPSSFGENDAVTGVWKPKKYAGTYGTNGFYLNFSDNSAATAAAIGKDSSGNGNNWTPNNISVTAGVTYDSMLDTPTPYADGGNGRGNYATMSQAMTGAGTYAGATVSAAGLNVDYAGGNGYIAISPWTINSAHPKLYFETYLGAINSGHPNIGLAPVGHQRTNPYAGTPAGNSGIGTWFNSVFFNGGLISTGVSWVAGDIAQFAYDPATGKFWLGRNGTWVLSGDPASGVNPLATLATTVEYNPFISMGYSGTTSFNFGQRPFAYTPPTGFKALNTQNLPDSTIKKGGSYFNAVTYTGNGATGQTITGAGFQPDLVWVKSRSNAYDNGLQDSVRGATKDLNSNNTDAEETRASSITAFASNGFTLGGNDLVYNGSGATYVGWQWKESATAGFDIVTYTGTGSSGQTVNHSLGVKPAMVIIKARGTTTGAGQWIVQHQSLSGGVNATSSLFTLTSYTSIVYLNLTNAASSYTYDYQVGQNGIGYVAYLFAEVAGFSKFGSYTGNGSADGPFVYCGFRPRFILYKAATGTAYNWGIYDTARDTYNVASANLAPNSSAAEATAAYMDILSNGFKIRAVGNLNENGSTYIYAAFAENPFKNSLAR